MSSMNNKLNVDKHWFDIRACHTIKSGTRSRKPGSDNVIVPFINRKKMQILNKVKLLKGRMLFYK